MAKIVRDGRVLLRRSTIAGQIPVPGSGDDHTTWTGSSMIYEGEQFFNLEDVKLWIRSTGNTQSSINEIPIYDATTPSNQQITYINGTKLAGTSSLKYNGTDLIVNGTSISTTLSTEISNRISGDFSLSTLLSNEMSLEVSTRDSADSSLSSDLSVNLSTEISNRISGDYSLSTLLSNEMSLEVSTRDSADSSLSSDLSVNLSTEISSRISGDTSLSTIILDSNDFTSNLKEGDVLFYTGQTISGKTVAESTYTSAYSGLTTTSTVGGVVSGTVISTLTGKTFSVLFDDIFVPTVLASASAKYLLLNGIPSTNIELGEHYTPSVTTTYYAGLITNGNGTVGPSLVGAATLYTFKLPGGVTDGVPSATSTHTYVAPVTVGLSTYQWSVYANHAAGTGAYYDNKGNVDTHLDGQRIATTLILLANSGTITGLNKIYWGTSANTSLSSAQVIALAIGELDTTRVKSYSINGGGEYLYYCYPTRFGGPASFNVGGFTVTFIQTIVSVTNATAVPYTENYYVYRSEFVSGGIGIPIIVT